MSLRRTLPTTAVLSLVAIALAACSSAPSEDATASCEGTACPGPPRTCGVGLPLPCADGAGCQQDSDCTTDYCATTCAAPPPGVHEDGRRNGGETGVDCGGTAATRCGGGQACVTEADCLSVCNAGICAEPSAADGRKNQGESDVDCGGPTAPKCVRDKACTVNADCQLLACAAGVCGTPTSTDGVTNGGETDVDCGGPGVTEGAFAYAAPRCKDFRGCAVDADCLGGFCSPTGQCVARSCDTAETAGITTCGAKEVDELGVQHETCCKSLPLPTRSMRLDKYEITAGRFRSFVDAVGPDIRSWVATYVAGKPGSQLAGLLLGAPVVGNLFPQVKKGGPLNLIAHLGLDIDNYNGNRGCYNGEGSYAHNTYWQDITDLNEYGIPARPLPRAVTDAKSMNCAMPIMFMAFCAWDGGELARYADFKDAWGTMRYPWGDTPVPQTTDTIPKPTSGNYNWCNGEAGDPVGTGGFKCHNTALGVNGNFYRYPAGTNIANDLSPFISSPGRFPADATALKSSGEAWFDIFGNMAEYTGDVTVVNGEFCDFSAAPLAGATTCTRANKAGLGTRYTGIPNVGIVGRSWEGHPYDSAPSNPGSVNGTFATLQYGKFGARCVRPIQ